MKTPSKLDKIREIVNARGLTLTTYPSGAVRISGPGGIDVLAASLSHVDLRTLCAGWVRRSVSGRIT